MSQKNPVIGINPDADYRYSVAWLDEIEQIPDLDLKDKNDNKIKGISPERFYALTHSPEARYIREMLVKHPNPMKLDEMTERLNILTKQHHSQHEVLRWIDVCSGTQPNAKDPAFLKVRAHIFQRNTQGIWACVDKDCRLKHGTPLEKGWPFGYVYVNQRQNCDCGSPVYEVAFCNDCNEPHLLARDKKGKLVQWENKGGDEFSLQDARYCPGAIGDTIRRAINEGAEKLTLWMTGAPNEWDLYARQFRAAVQSYRLKDNVEVDLVIPAGVDDPDLLYELSQFTALGVRLCHVEQDLQLPIVAQVTFADRVMTLASRSQQATIPGPEWHLNDELVVRSLGYKTVELNEFILPAKAANAVERVKDIQIHKQLNGPLSQFGQRFWDVLFNDHEEAQSLMNNTRITGVHYTDRYLQNPVALALLGSILRPLKTKLTDGAEVALDTLFKDKDRPGNRPFHDWMSIADFQDFADQWFAAALGRPIELTVFDSPRDIPHHRKLTVTFEDGQVLKIRFDQGMGYWRINFASQWHYFDFRDDVSFQLVKMAQACNEGNVANSEESWATDVLVEVSAS